MSGLALFSEILANFPASRARKLDSSLAEWGGIEAVYALVWPDYELPTENHPKANREAFKTWRQEAVVPVWGWINCKADQAADAATIALLDGDLDPDGWLLDIEGEWVKDANLEVLCNAAVAAGVPVRASLAGSSASHVNYDFRTFDRLGITVDWQTYFDSGEGPYPSVGVAELYQSSFVIPGWTYRHRLGTKYGWGKVTRTEAGELGVFNSYLKPGADDAYFQVLPRDEWGWYVDDRILWPADPDKPPSGVLMGRAAYPRIRVTLDCTRGANDKHPLHVWTAIAASARVAGAKKRGVSVYLGEIVSDQVLAAIAAGAA